MPTSADDSAKRALEKFRRLNGEALAAQLQALGYDAVFVPSRAEALRELLARVPEGAAVGAGGSLTLGQIGALEALRERGHEILTSTEPGATWEEKLALRKRALFADVYLTGVNAMTADGELVNLDGTGNRVAATCFGPGRVIYVAGINKLAFDLEEAISRVRNHAAPANAMRLGLDTPCADTGYCHDCDSEQRICNRLVIHLRAGRGEHSVILVGEPLGL
ncbi:MAG TPA: lactate utilization protein [Candidatus Coatesbacteria bacterium]|nr:lactate utilization protein [Candidatus Coatesbacteria bacterium]